MHAEDHLSHEMAKDRTETEGIPPPIAVAAEENELPPAVAAAVARLDRLVKRFEEHPDPVVKDLVFELLSAVDGVHRVGLRRLNELLKVAGLQHRATDDPEVRLLFDLYDLGEGGDEARCAAIVESVKPGLDAMGVQIELVASTATTIHVRLTCPRHAEQSGLDDLRRSLAQVLLDGLPGVVHAEVEMVSLPAQALNNFVPIAALRMPPRLEWQPVGPLSALPAGTVHGFDLGEQRLLLVNLGSGEIYAYRNNCPDTPFPLDGATVEDCILRCPWHACRFDLRGGRRIDTQGPGLGVVPVRVEDGMVVVSVPRKAVPT
jgi:nitrite reductase/ring-hydroxylating ferredoxin subunit